MDFPLPAAAVLTNSTPMSAVLLPPAIRGQSGSVSVLPNPPTAADKVSLPVAAVLANSTPLSAPLAVSMPAAAVSAASTP